MLTPRGFADSTRPSSGRSRSQLQAERKQQMMASNSKWENAREARQNSHAKAASQRTFMRKSAAITKNKPVPSSAPPPPSTATGSSTVASFVLKGESTAHGGAAAASKAATASPPRGVRRTPGRDNHQECTTFFKDVVGRKVFPEHTACHTELAAENRSAACNDVGGCQGQTADGTGSETGSSAPSSHTPRQTLKPELPAKQRQHKPLTGTIGRMTNVPVAADPPVVPLHQMYLIRPHVTAAESYKVPIYSSFTPNHQYNPMLDAALKPHFRRMAKKREDAKNKVKMRHLIHAETVDEYNLALAKELASKRARRFQSGTDQDMKDAHENQAVGVPEMITPRGRGENGEATNAPKKLDDSYSSDGSRRNSPTQRGQRGFPSAWENVPQHPPAAAAEKTPPMSPAKLSPRNQDGGVHHHHHHHQQRRPSTGRALKTSDLVQAQQKKRNSILVGGSTATGGGNSPSSVNFAVPTPPKRPQTARISRNKQDGLQIGFSHVTNTRDIASEIDELEKVDEIFSNSSSSRPQSAKNRPRCSPAMAIEFGVCRQDAAIRSKSSMSTWSTASSGGVTTVSSSEKQLQQTSKTPTVAVVPPALSHSVPVGDPGADNAVASTSSS